MRLLMISLFGSFVFLMSPIHAQQEFAQGFGFKGDILGGLAADNPSLVTSSVSGLYLDEYFGIDVSFGFRNIDLSVEGVDSDSGTGWRTGAGVFGLAPIAGQPFKPYGKIGINYSSVDDTNSTSQTFTDLSLSAGSFFEITEHFLIGVQAISFGYILSGDVDAEGSPSLDLSGHWIGILDGVHVSYLF